MNRDLKTTMLVCLVLILILPIFPTYADLWPTRKFYCIQDSFTRDDPDPDANFNYPPNHQLEAGSNAGLRASFIEFDKSALEQFNSCKNATLWLRGYVWGTATNISVWVEPVIEKWNETTITYNNEPSHTSAISQKYVDYNGGVTYWVGFSVTDFFNSWFQDHFAWFGFRIGGAWDDIFVMNYFQHEWQELNGTLNYAHVVFNDLAIEWVDPSPPIEDYIPLGMGLGGLGILAFLPLFLVVMIKRKKMHWIPYSFMLLVIAIGLVISWLWG